MKYLIKNKNWNIVEEYNLDKLLYFLVDRPVEIDTNFGFYIWKYKNNKFHRKYDLPAYVRKYDLPICSNAIVFDGIF